jgi:hypothetical protein
MIAALASVLLAVVPHGHEGDVQAFTSLTDAEGRPLADARYTQTIAGDVLHIESRADFPGGRSIIEQAALRLRPQIEQLSWSWSEHQGNKLVREYTVDFTTGKAVATRVDQEKRWKEDLEIERGKTFAGIGFLTVVKALRGQLKPGEQIELRAVAMTPKPRTATVTVKREGADVVHMAGRTIEGDRYVIHPEIPAIAKLFVSAPDQHVWLIGRDPPAFLRFEGPLVEPGDPIIRIDLIPGPPAHAQPRAARRVTRRGASRQQR